MTRPPDECPFARPFNVDFDDCAAYKPDEYVPLDMHYQPLPAVWTCANLRAQEVPDVEGRFYGQCRLGHAAARKAWANAAAPGRLEALRRLRREIYALAADYREEIWQAKGVQLKAFAHGKNSAAATRKLYALADRNLADVRLYLDANPELLAELGMPKQPLLELIRHLLDRFVTQPGGESPGPPAPEVLGRFPIAVRRLMQPDKRTVPADAGSAPTD